MKNLWNYLTCLFNLPFRLKRHSLHTSTFGWTEEITFYFKSENKLPSNSYNRVLSTSVCKIPHAKCILCAGHSFPPCISPSPPYENWYKVYLLGAIDFLASLLNWFFQESNSLRKSVQHIVICCMLFIILFIRWWGTHIKLLLTLRCVFPHNVNNLRLYKSFLSCVSNMPSLLMESKILTCRLTTCYIGYLSRPLLLILPINFVAYFIVL